mmetsp:Transcript_28358/g.76742  ORF Transcript_28358/g.76742 Transcript_28358/m.76742 type:complete len:164 (-) Transcript_28358:167-658(-)|eukprot:1763884-Prymnesium_polylepis.1
MVMSAALLLAPYGFTAGSVMYVAHGLPASSVEAALLGCVVLGAIKGLAASLLKIRLLPSRWSFITYQAHARLLTDSLSALSPYALLGIERYLAPFAAPFAPELTWRSCDHVWVARGSCEPLTPLFLMALPFVSLKYVVQLFALRDMVAERFVPTVPLRPLPSL